ARQRQFHDRPFHIVGTEDVGIGGFIQALRAGMTDEKVRRIADDRLFGSVDHISDNPDFLMAGKWRIKLHSLYE
ncbi:MAG: hypothetical protein JOZ57_11650, partial [Abitibacteriaceae bacterium]|nr:hypothetical protein [Abditibacteriaceae bacterium]